MWLPFAIKLAISKTQKLQVGHPMGFILDLTAMLKEPAGMVGAVVVIAAVYALIKWVFAPHPDDEQ
jgi:hypothetical protein